MCEFKKCLSIFMVVVFMLPNFLYAKNLTQLSDTISTSIPSFPSNHSIKFKTTEAVPASGKIKITFDSDYFTFPAGIDYTAVDLATSSEYNSGFGDRVLASTSGATYDGVLFEGSSTPNYIELSLNSNFGISSSTYVKIDIGTNANFGTSSLLSVLNATTTGSYSVLVETYNPANALLDRKETSLAIVEPVALTGSYSKIRANGTPSGTLAYGTTQAYMSLTTNYQASCRYSTASGTDYTSMTDDFSYTGANYHSILLTGLTGGLYDYFVRCRDSNLVDDTTDYEIKFYIEATDGNTGNGSDDNNNDGDTPGGGSGTSSGGSSGGGGAGGGGGGGIGSGSGSGSGDKLPYPPLPDNPNIFISGYGYPGRETIILKDGVVAQKVFADSKGAFTFQLEEIERGVYSFAIYSTDSEGRKSASYSTTFWVEVDTVTSVSDIFLSPTIQVTNSELQTGDTLEVFGQSIIDGKAEAWFYSKVNRPLADSEIIKKSASTTNGGLYNLVLSTSDLLAGQYGVKVRSSRKDLNYSGFSQVVDIGLDESVVASGCPNGDLNGDKKVNITDFSILLYYWGGNNTCADQNTDGTVNLTDFSILMFYWTG